MDRCVQFVREMVREGERKSIHIVARAFLLLYGVLWLHSRLHGSECTTERAIEIYICARNGERERKRERER